MTSTTLRRPMPGRSGGLRSARRALWESIHAARQVLAQADEPTVVLRTCEALTQSITQYIVIMRAIEHPDAP